MKITEILKSKKTFSFEFFPPKDEKGLEDLANSVRELARLGPDFVSVTDSDRGNSKYKHLALSRVIKEKTGLNPMLHLTCVNNTREEIRNVLDHAARLGIDNILALRGDRGNFEAPQKTVFPYAENLVRELARDGRFCIGVAGHPEKHPEAPSLEKDVDNLKRKLDQGGEFIITQLFFDNSVFFRYRDLLRARGIKAPLVAGIMPVTNPNIFKKLLEKTGEIKVPDALIKIMGKSGADKASFMRESVDFSCIQCRELLANDVEALHFFTFNRATAAKIIFGKIRGGCVK